jgi:hypothetical protein
MEPIRKIKKQAHFITQVGTSRNSTTHVQARSLEGYFSLAYKRPMGHQSGSKEVQSGLAAAFTSLALGQSGGQFLSRTAGAVLNPNLELLFSAPTLRPFNFTFKLASRSPKESETIRSIIRFFKQGMSPQRSQSNLFLKAPHTFQIQYLHRNEEHKFLNKFKECALQSFNVNYTPEGQYATFTDGAMVSYQITMQFQELEPVFNDDYTNDGTNPSPDIGF